MFTRILVPTDFSAGAETALQYAKVIAGRFGASLHLIHVLEDPVAMAISVEGYVPDLPGLRETMVRDAKEEIESRLSPIDRRALRATTDVFFGAGAVSIVEYAAEHGIDLIVMGTHGRTGMSHLLMGSVAERVVRTAPCAVMTVREGTRLPKTRPVDAEAAMPA